MAGDFMMNEERSITSLHHPLVKHMVKLRTDSTYRKEQKLLVFEGVKPIAELSPFFTQLFYTPSYAAQASSLPGKKWQITDAILKKIAGTSSPEGMIAEIPMPPYVLLDKQRLVLALDGIGDPGNLGTLLRTALAFGWETVYFLPGCCDPFNDKALRSARGAHFKLTLAYGTGEELKQWAEKRKAKTLIADLGGKPPEKIAETSPRLLVLGNEAHGASGAIRAFCEPVTIPMPGEMESLNVAVAGGILLYLLSTDQA
jgi:RNA methyltransferase, TrmH family